MEESRAKPDGGFCLVPAMGIVRAWWAYKRGFLELVDVRVYLACFELVARRCGLTKGRMPRYRVEELRPLVGGVGGEHTRASLRRLTKLGLLDWSDTKASPLAGESVESLDMEGELDTKRRLLVNHRRMVPMPRRMLRHIAESRRPVEIATLLGHMFRCLYHRGTVLRPNGLCKASWVADVFDVDTRNVKAARSDLVRQGLLHTGAAPQHVLNRHGLPVSVNLAWSPAVESDSPPRRRFPTPQSPPPRETGNSLPRSENQKPGVPVPFGVRKRTGMQSSMSNIEKRDLLEPSRLQMLWIAATGVDGRTASEANRIRFFSAAAHALRVARSNACGLFASVIRHNLWDFLSQEDEDHGRRLAATVHGL